MPLEVARSVIDQKFAVVGVEFFAESVNYLLKKHVQPIVFQPIRGLASRLAYRVISVGWVIFTTARTSEISKLKSAFKSPAV